MRIVIATSILTFALAACSSKPTKNKETSDNNFKVPENVQNAFKQHFPQETDVKWEKEGENFEAMFAHDVTETSMVINAKGEVLETEIEMDSSTLPESILTYFDTNYRGYKIAEASKIVLNNGNINYEAEVNDKDFIFDSNGRLLDQLN